MAYQPASNLTTTGTIAHLATVYYNRKALDTLRARFRFLQATEPDILPRRNGKTMQWYRYSTLAANTTAATEGTVGTGLALTTTTVSATVSEYSDFISVSSLLDETAIDPIVANAATELGYRAALSVDTIVRTEINSSATPEINTLGSSATAGDFRRAVALLGGLNVQPKMGDKFVGIIHPYVKYDLMSDNTAGGFIDVMKYANPQALVEGEIGEIAGVRLFETTNVRTSGTAPNVLYDCYVHGLGGVGAVDLAGSGPSKIADPTKQAFRINTVRGGPNTADPEGMIGAFVSYRYVFVTKILDSTNFRYRVIRADASLV